jgi:porin
MMVRTLYATAAAGVLAALLAPADAVAQDQQVDIGAPAPPPTAPAAPAANDTKKPATEPTATPDATARPATPALKRRVPNHMLHQRDTSPDGQISDTQSAAPPGLFGDWRNSRTWLGERGVDVSARYASETAYNPTGGRHQAITETGQFDIGAKVDMGKLVGLEGGTLQATLTWRRGDNLSDVAGLNTLQQVQEVYGRGQTVRVTELWYEQKIGDSVELKLGRTNPGSDFAVFSCHFQNLTFCGAQPGNLVGDYWQNWPVGQWGGRLHVDVRPGVYLQLGAYEVNPLNLRNNFFVARWHGATGALIPFEAGWTHGGDGGHVGSYKVGGWYTTANGSDVYLDINRRPIVVTGLAPLQHSGRYGGYVSIQQQITGKSKDGKSLDGLGVFANFTQTDRATAVTDNQAVVGVFYKGLATWLPGDVLGVAFGRTNVNGRAADADRLLPNTPVRDAEYAAEVYYSVTPLPWLELQPNVQWIHHPGGVRSADEVVVLGLKGAITL